VLALAGVRRLGLEERVTEIIPADLSLPAIGQGALGIETRMDDKEVEGQIRFLNDRDASIAVTAERAFLKRLEGGCQVPLAAFAQPEGMTLRVEGLVGSTDGKRLIRHRVEGPVENAESLGVQLAEILLGKGAREILDEVYQRSGPLVEIP
jgi:hydroxymethylbilane synthase